MEDCPECYGKKDLSNKIAECPSCEFLKSCIYYCKEDDKKMNRGSGHVSFENYSYSHEIADQPAEIEDEPDENEAPASDRKGKYTDQDMLRLMEFMFRIDDYSLAIIEKVLNRNLITASDAARVFKVSRQAIHRKLLDSCRKNPELRNLLHANLYRCKRLREDIEPKTPETKILQPELF